MAETEEKIDVPENLPEPGFYYHFKHDSNGPVNVMAYEVLGVQFHTERESLEVSYRPVYREAMSYVNGLLGGYSRPLDMFMETVEKPEYSGPRFIKITDSEVIAQLRTIRDEMYPQS